MWDKRLHEIFKSNENFSPDRVGTRCKRCGTRLKILNAGGKLYAVKCEKCEKILVTKADNPAEAALLVGVPSTKININSEYRYEVLIYNVANRPGVEVAARLKKYPTWADMMQICWDNDIRDVMDFKDIDNCLNDNLRVIRGIGLGNARKRLLKFQVTKLTDSPVDFTELLVKGEDEYESDN